MAIGNWRIDIVAWSTEESQSPTTVLDVKPDHEKVEVWLSDWDRPPKQFQGNRKDVAGATDFAEVAHLKLALSRDGILEVQTDSLGNERCFIEASPGRVLVSNEPWSLIANSTNKNRRQLKPESSKELLVTVEKGTVARATTRLTAEPRRTRGAWPDRDLRTLVAAEIERIADRFHRMGILLSGGIDSAAVVAFTGKHLLNRVKLIHARFPGTYRNWETVLARQVARGKGAELIEIQFRDDQLLSQAAMRSDAMQHHWLGWHLQLQRQSAFYADVILTGRSAEWFNGDAAGSVWNALAAPQLALRSRSVIAALPIARSAWALVTGRSPKSVPVDNFGWSFEPGQRFLLANPFAGRCVPKYCPFQTKPIFRLAQTLEGTGFRVEKLVVRLAVSDEVPRKVIATARQGSSRITELPAFARQCYLQGLTEEGLSDEISAATESRHHDVLVSKSPPAFRPTAVTAKVIR